MDTKDGKTKLPVRRIEEKASVQLERPNDRGGHGQVSNSRNSSDERKSAPAPSTTEHVPAARISIPVPPKGPEQAAPVTEQVIQKKKPTVPTESSKPDADSLSPSKVDYATDLFNMLSIDGSVEKAAGASGDDMTGAGFQAADAFSLTVEKTGPAKVDDNKTLSTNGIEDLFKDSPSIAPSSMSGKPQKDVKNDIISL